MPAAFAHAINTKCGRLCVCHAHICKLISGIFWVGGDARALSKANEPRAQAAVFHVRSLPLPFWLFNLQFTIYKLHASLSASHPRRAYLCLHYRILSSCALAAHLHIFRQLYFAYAKHFAAHSNTISRPFARFVLQFAFFTICFASLPLRARPPLRQPRSLYWSHNRTEVVVFWLAPVAGRGEKKRQQQGRLGGFFLWESSEHFFMARQFLIDDAWKFRMHANYRGLGKCYSTGACLCPLLICIFD